MIDCIFCKIIAGDIPSTKIHEDAHTLAFLDIHPINHGHTLVIPRAHYRHALETPDGPMTHVMAAVKRVGQALIEGLGAEGVTIKFNCESAGGQDVFHTHAHVIPRYAGDGHQNWTQGDYKEGEKAVVAEKMRAKLS